MNNDNDKNNNSVFNYLEQLKNKKMTKPRPKFIIHLKKNENNVKKNNVKKNNVKESNVKEEEREEGEVDEDEEEEYIKTIKGKSTQIIYSDKRDFVNVDRKIILSRLQNNSNIRNVENNISVFNKGNFKNIPTSTTKSSEIITSAPSSTPPLLQTLSSSTQLRLQNPNIDKVQTIKFKKKLVIREELPEKEKSFEEEKLPEKEKSFEEEEELPDELPDDTTSTDNTIPIIQNKDVEEEVEESISQREENIIPKELPKKRGRKKKSKSEEENEKEEKEEKEEEKEVIPKTKKGKMTRKNYEEFRFGEQAIDNKIKINRKALINRLPKREKFIVKTSHYYMNNRKLYIQKMTELFKPYKKELLNNIENNSCDNVSKNTDLKLLTHQKVVRDYLNLYTPYRGLLIYHMLGSGKTCTSIAIAEGMKTQRPIVLMTPASLKTNFFYELKKCGDLMYRRNQYWEFINTDGKPEYIDILSKVLLISRETIEKNKGAWLVDITEKESNYNKLSTQEQSSIDQQIDMMIRSKYLDINYNGLTKKIFNDLTEDLTKNPFDNCTVIIDEAHNFVSRIVNKLKKPNSISYIMYEYLMRANNARIILVTGTPIINYPNELGILFNILRGYIKKWTFQLNIKNTAPSGFKVNHVEIIKYFKREGLNTYDYIEYTGNKLIITRNPFGFINTEKNEKEIKKGGKNKSKKKIIIKKKNISKKNRINLNPYIIENNIIKKIKDEKEMDIEEEATIEYNDRVNIDLRKGGSNDEEYNGVTVDETGNISDDEFVFQIKRILNKYHMDVVESGSSYEELKALPDDSETFMKMFINQDTNTISNENTFKKRILGLSSYFKSGSESLLPNFVKTQNNEDYHIEYIEMSDYQFSIYEKIRKEEAESEKLKRKNKKKEAQGEQNLFEIPSTYRIFSRAACNFAFPTPPGRPMPDKNNSNDSEVNEIDNNIQILIQDSLKPIPEFENQVELNKKIKTLTTILKDVSELLEEFSEGERIIITDNISKFNSIKEKIKNSGVNIEVNIEDMNSIDDILSVLRTLIDKKTKKIPENIEYINNEEEIEVIDEPVNSSNETDVDGTSGSVEYQARIKSALNMIKYNPEKTLEEQYLNEENLKMYSPKFLKILNNIKNVDNKGLHLLYSQFRTIEGIGIMKLILETNGYSEFKIKKNESSGLWDIMESQDDIGKPRFVLYTGTETVEEKEIIRNIYNSNWEVVPTSITSKLREISSNNFYGEIIKLLMITSSGAEGINLRNTRFVHIIEPYWHMVRLEQVIGRARRICSHNDLPQEERTVKVFLYLSVFSKEQKTNNKNIELMNRDVSRIDGRPITTDESLLDTAFKKEKINNQLLDSIKETSIDCNLYNPFNKEENLVCYGYGKVTSNSFSSYPTIDQDLGEIEEINVKQKKINLKASKPINGIIYAIDPKTLDAYDMESYNRALKGIGELELVGKIEKVGKNLVFMPK